MSDGSQKADTGEKPAGNKIDFAAVLAKAKAAAAKINTDDGVKRKSEGDAQPDSKRPAQVYVAPTGSQIMTASGEVLGTIDAALPAIPGQGMGYGSFPPTQTNQSLPTEDIQVPNELVGRIIGRGGEMINRLQNDSGCRIQISQDLGKTNRPVTLVGTDDAIAVISAAGGSLPFFDSDSGDMSMEKKDIMYIPAEKVGLVIGKGGEMIKLVQERSGAKMSLNQDDPHAREKPLSIQGTDDIIQKAKKMVSDILNGRDVDLSGDTRQLRLEVKVPQVAVGRVIGKGGENIKRIQAQTGCRVQFEQTNQDAGADYRIATLSGTQDMIESAEQLIHEIIQEAENPSSRIPDGLPRITLSVASDKAGLVIGRGGETIRQIQDQSGAHVELDRSHNRNPLEKTFVICGLAVRTVFLSQLSQEQTIKLIERNDQSWRRPLYQSGQDPYSQMAYMFSNYFASGGGANQDPYAYPQQPPGGDVPQQQPPQQQQQQQQEQQQYQSEGGQYPTQEQYEMYKDWYNSQGYYGNPAAGGSSGDIAESAAAQAAAWAARKKST